MARSPFTFAGALDLLEPERKKIAALDKILGGAILIGGAGAAIAGAPLPLVGVGAATILGLVDPKNEATKLLGPLVDRTVGRIKGGQEQNQYDLVVAAHTITVLSSFFDALRKEIGRPYIELQLAEREMVRLADMPDASGTVQTFIEALVATDVPLPSAEFGVIENLEQRIVPYYQRLATTCINFFTGLEAWQRIVRSDETFRVVNTVTAAAATTYRGRMLRLGKGGPFALWVALNEHAATRATHAAALGELKAMLPLLLRGAPAPEQSYRAQLALTAREVLGERLLRSGAYAGVSPSVEQGFVEPAFNLAYYQAFTAPADETWWAQHPVNESIVDYLSSYLADESSTELPLVLLGHPGAGKSLLTEVLAAQLPADSFAVVRVPLRRVNTDDELAVQITKELQRTLQRPQADLAELRAECVGQCRLVILLDGYDELIQATGVTQSGYLNKITEFQKRARTLGLPTSVIITSRTVVAEHADIPLGTPILKLCEFDGPRIGSWLTTWNAAHQDVPGFQPLTAEMLTDQDSVAELACQPLLLLILAIYLAEVGTDILRGDLSQANLYRRILDRFISRQVVEKTQSDLDHPHQKALESQQRRHLQFAAVGMFSRGRQHITDSELDADLAALAPQVTKASEVTALRQAHRVLGAFMFVHNAKADREQREAYEFLHATFGEYLVAELTFEQLLRLDSLRRVEADGPADGTTRLDDLALRRVLSHQPLSTRRSTLSFLIELTTELDTDRQASVLATITELIRSAKIRPDVPDDLYSPSPYDPVRRRAAYSANLTLLRVLLGPAPVTPAEIIGSSDPADWESHVRLWRAGLDTSAWLTVVEAIGALPTDHLELYQRLTHHRGIYAEAELLGHRGLMADLLLGSHLAEAPGGHWPGDELAAAILLAKISTTRTGTPYLGRMLPLDLALYVELSSILAVGTSNDELAKRIIVMLSRDAEYLPIEVIEPLLGNIDPVHYVGRGPELAMVAAAHPSILHRNPEVHRTIRDLDPEDGACVVAVLWRASTAHSGAEHSLLTALLDEIDRAMAAIPGLKLRDAYFAPQFVTYLRQVRPSHWNTARLDRIDLYDALTTPVLASIEPADFLYLVQTMPLFDESLVKRYLSWRGIPHSGSDLLDNLRKIVAGQD